MWKDVPGFEHGYQINKDAQVRTKEREFSTSFGNWGKKTIPSRIIKPSRTNQDGSIIYNLRSKSGLAKTLNASKVVKEIFNET